MVTDIKHVRVMLLNTGVAPNVKLAINSFPSQYFSPTLPYISIIFGQLPDISQTVVKFLGISYFSRQVVTLIEWVSIVKLSV